MNTHHLEVQNLSFTYPEAKTAAFEEASFHLERWDILGILGPNGGGKTTLLKVLAVIYSPSKGHVLYQGQPYHGPFQNKKRPSFIYLPQKDPRETLLPFTLKEWLKATTFPRKKLSTTEIHHALEKVALAKSLDTLVSTLSGGESQRLQLARVYLSPGELVLMDEPSRGLDTEGREHLLLIIKELREENRVSIILVDHHINQLLKHCDRILCLNQSFHWHDVRGGINQEILEKTYGCEFEKGLTPQ